LLIVINGELPVMNDIIAAAKRNRFKYAEMKRNYTEICGYAALKKTAIENQVDVKIIWYCKNKKKDKDGIIAGTKFIMDGLQMAGVIQNDNWACVRNYIFEFEVDKINPRIIVELIDTGNIIKSRKRA
jgi:Holliday junction resolvase RusA-like endonuclease